MKLAVFISVPMLSLALSSMAQAVSTQTCFKDKDGWEAAKAKLPVAFQKLPLHLTHADGSTMLSGAMAIDWVEKDKVFFINFTGHHAFGGNQSDSGAVKNFCLSPDGKTLTVSNAKGAKTFQFLSDNQVNIEDYVFTVEPNDRKFATTVTQIQGMNRGVSYQAIRERNEGYQ